MMSGNGPVYPGLIPDIDFGMKLMSGIGPVMSGIWPVMSGIGPVMSGILPGMSVTGPLMYGIWPKICSEHRTLMSGTWSEKAGHIPDMAERCPEHDQLFLALFPTWHNNVRNVARIIAYQCNVSGLIPYINGPVPDIIGHIPDVRMMFRTSFSTIF